LQGILYFVVKTLQFMIGKQPNQTQRDFFKPLLTDFIDLSHELILLSNKIDWSSILKNTFQNTTPT
jgi:IS5 family transposase